MPSDADFTLRLLRRDDAEAAAALIRLAFARQPVATDPPSSALGLTAEAVAAELAAGGGCGFIEGGELVGVVLWSECAGGLYCGRLAVRPDRRGRGLARRLVAAAEEEAGRRGLPRLHVKVRLALAGNRRLFEACGFVEVGREAHPGHTAPTTAILEKRLDP